MRLLFSAFNVFEREVYRSFLFLSLAFSSVEKGIYLYIKIKRHEKGVDRKKTGGFQVFERPSFLDGREENEISTPTSESSMEI